MNPVHTQRPGTILVTGGAGFIGSAVIRHLLGTTDVQIVNVDKLTYAGNLATLGPFRDHSRHHFVQLDINERSTMAELIVGEGPLRAELEAQSHELGIDDQVRFHGAVPHHALPEYYRRAAIAVFPFVEAADGDQEGFGLVVVEAMGCGCAVIASDLPAVRDPIPDDQSGLRVRPGDAEQIASALHSLMRDPDRMRNLASQGRPCVST